MDMISFAAGMASGGGSGGSGIPGRDGKSAYEIAVDNGFQGTEAQWLESLKGADGVDGTNGVTPDIQVGNVETLPAGSDAYVTRQPESPNAAPVFDFGIPKGANGSNGGGGDGEVILPAVEVGTVETLPAGASATVSINPSSTENRLILDFGIPRGEDGVDGANGSDGTEAGTLSDGSVTLSLPLAIANGGTGNNTGRVQVGKLEGSTLNATATAEGTGNTASKANCHAEGINTTASGTASHSEGNGSTASGNYSHAEGNGSTASGKYTHAECFQTTASGNYSHAEGNGSTASGTSSHAEGYHASAEGDYSHAEGYNSSVSGRHAHAEGYGAQVLADYGHAEGRKGTVTGLYGHAEGNDTTASGEAAHAGGHYTTASNFASRSCGKYNKAMTDGGASDNVVGDAFVIGNGYSRYSGYTTTITRSNALRVTYEGDVLATKAFQSSGADYAEYFEWLDGNPDNEDRVGYFAALDGEMIRKARSDDDVLGVVSGLPCIIGNSDEDWLGRWIHDDFDRIVLEYLDENGEVTDEKTESWRFKENPAYDPKQTYIPRAQRREWAAIGMLGVLAVRDDGTCVPNGYCTVADDGTATAVESRAGYRVLKRVSQNVVKILFRK